MQYVMKQKWSSGVAGFAEATWLAGWAAKIGAPPVVAGTAAILGCAVLLPEHDMNSPKRHQCQSDITQKYTQKDPGTFLHQHDYWKNEKSLKKNRENRENRPSMDIGHWQSKHMPWVLLSMALSILLSTSITTVWYITMMSIKCHQMSLIQTIYCIFAAKISLIHSQSQSNQTHCSISWSAKVFK